LEGDAVNGFRERIEQIQAKIKQEKSRLRVDHPFNPLQKSVDSFPPAKRLSARLDAQLVSRSAGAEQGSGERLD
jgi:hypothetical protein